MKKSTRIKISELRKTVKENNSETFDDLEFVKVVVTDISSEKGDIRRVDFYSNLGEDGYSELDGTGKRVATMKIQVTEETTIVLQSSINSKELPGFLVSLLQSLYV